jgi:hypothetical protein
MKFPPARLSTPLPLLVETEHCTGTTWDNLAEPNIRLALENYRSMSRSDNGYCPDRARENKIMTEKLTAILAAISEKLAAKSVDGE